MKYFPRNSTILVVKLFIDMAVFSRKYSKKAAPKKSPSKAAYKKATKKGAVKKAAKKAAYRDIVPNRIKGHARKILHSIDEAEKIHRGEKRGISFDDFLAGF